jgi:hypothetical protein
MVKGLHHIIFISFKPETPQEIQDEVYNRYQELDKEVGGSEAGIIFWSVKKNLDLRKNIHLVEYAIFLNDESFQNFKKHPKHVELVNNYLIHHCDWHVGDFIID